MTALSPEGNTSHEPSERHIEGGTTASQELLDKMMGPARSWSSYFEVLIDGRFPKGLNTASRMPESRERVGNKKIASKLDEYENFISDGKFSETVDLLLSEALYSSDAKTKHIELRPHIINKHIMSMLFQVFAGPQFAPNDEQFHVAKAKLALESYSIIAYRDSILPADVSYLDKLILDIEAILWHLNTISTSADKGVKGRAVISNPSYDPVNPDFTPEVLIFTPNDTQGYDKSLFTTVGTLGDDYVLGDMTRKILNESSVSELSRNEGFKQSFHEFVGARIAIRTVMQNKTESS